MISWRTPAVSVALFVAAVGGAGRPVMQGSPTVFTPALRFPAADTRGSFEQQLGRDLVVKVRRAVDAQGNHFGWDLSVLDRRLAESPDFLYERLSFHGPQPNDLYAWRFRGGQLQNVILPVYGYPYELRVRFIDCQIAGGEGTEARFTTGTIEIGWRRLAESNPKQRPRRDNR